MYGVDNLSEVHGESEAEIPQSPGPALGDLAHADVHSNRAGVVVLEIFHHVISAAAHLVADCLSGSTGSTCHGVRIAWLKAATPHIALFSGLIGPASLFSGRGLHHADHTLARARGRVAGCLKILLFRE